MRLAQPDTLVQDKADPTKITNTQRIDGALPTIKKAGGCRCEGVRLPEPGDRMLRFCGVCVWVVVSACEPRAWGGEGWVGGAGGDKLCS